MKKTRYLKILYKPEIWVLAALIIIFAIIQYPQQLVGWKTDSLFSAFGLSSFTIERLLLLIPIVYSALVFGVIPGLAILISAMAIIFPRDILMTSNQVQAWIESGAVILLGILVNVLVYFYRRSESNTEKTFARTIDGMSIPCFAINMEHKVIYWNHALEVMSHIQRKEIMNTDGQWRAFYSEKRPVLADLIVNGALEEELKKLYPRSGKKSALIEGAFEAEDFLTTGNNGRWLHFTASPIRDNNGALVGAIETLENITEQKRTEEALQGSEKKFRDLFESALDPIWVHDLEGNLILVNKAAAECTGRNVEEILKINVKSMLAPESLRLAQDIRHRLLQNEAIDTPYEQKIIRKDGGHAIFMVRTNLLLDDGKPVAFQNIARDVTETKQMMESLRYYLQQITRAQEDERRRISRELHDSTAQNLIAMLHRLENVIGRIKPPSPETTELWSIHEQIRDILREVRGYSRDLRPSIIDDLGLVPALEWITDATKTEYKIDTSLSVSGNRRRLSPEAELLLFRIAQESLRNVGKHANASSARVFIEFSGKEITLQISDNGTGFSAPDNLGDLTFRGKLGLIGMRERAQLLGGTLKVDSVPGQGTKIIVNVPV